MQEGRMRHENNFGEVRLPDGEGLRLEVAITDPREACECATAWIGEADTVLDVISDGVFNDIMIPAGHIKTRPGVEIHEAAQKLLNLMIVARRELTMARELVGAFYPLLPLVEEAAPPLRRAVIDLRQKAWDRALAEYTAANAADARIEEGPDGVYTDQAPAKFAMMLATAAPTIDAFHAKFEIVIQDLLLDATAEDYARLHALATDFQALMQRRSRDEAEAA
jgi:hypothetical protein